MEVRNAANTMLQTGLQVKSCTTMGIRESDASGSGMNYLTLRTLETKKIVKVACIEADIHLMKISYMTLTL